MSGVYKQIDEAIVKDLIEMDFNKESVCNYYQQQVPIMKEKGLIQEQDSQCAEVSHGFQALFMTLNPVTL